MELYLIRHGQSTNNALEDFRQRVSDPPLTDLGERQAALVAGQLATILGTARPGAAVADSAAERETSTRVASEGEVARDQQDVRLYCSAMWRSLQTAQPIAEALDVEAEVWVDIHEHGGIFLDHGDEQGIVGYPGKLRAEILAAFPRYVLPETITEEGWWQGGCEELDVCRARARQVAEQLKARAANQERVLLVTHGTFMNELLVALLNQQHDRMTRYVHYNTGITRLEFFPDGLLLVWYLNRVDHLPPALLS